MKRLNQRCCLKSLFGDSLLVKLKVTWRNSAVYSEPMVFCSYMSFLNPNHVLKYFLERKEEKGKRHRLVFFSLLHCCTTDKTHTLWMWKVELP